ncbi:manganese efflux pump [Butyrivibrio sp. INlla16]|uniref:manganese efflux pump MntP n=1 Tax=Butyrivibrio sp. INlla16 TaxID=1520807 RepID=UPI0008874A54|nr:manganese efflux pump [Butyrivibrio sp. INlla16]SDB02570.1 Putative Mn2+ efflux pump MntP [Butyrivibrio sp. INlla16]
MSNIILLISNSILLGIGLAMDAFSVSIANAIADPEMNPKRKNVIAGTFAGFQFLMPMIGWICVHTIATIFTQFQVLIPWIALILLSYIGGKMLIEGIKEQKSDEPIEKEPLTVKLLMVQGIATAIDALSVGFTISDYNAPEALVSALIIGAVTFVICRIGLHLGRKVGLKLAGRAIIVGGIILIGIGIEIFVRGFFGI